MVRVPRSGNGCDADGGVRVDNFPLCWAAARVANGDSLIFAVRWGIFFAADGDDIGCDTGRCDLLHDEWDGTDGGVGRVLGADCCDCD